MSETTDLSDICFVQNYGYYDENLYVPCTASNDGTRTQYFQEFTLPADYARVDNQPSSNAPTGQPVLNPPPQTLDSQITVSNDRTIRTTPPPLTGFQVLCGVTSGLARSAAFDWTLEHYDQGGWEMLAKGTQAGAHADSNEVWFDIFFQKPVPIQAAWLSDLFRLSVTPHINSNPKRDVLCEWDGERVIFPNGRWRYFNYLIPDSIGYDWDDMGWTYWSWYIDTHGYFYASECGGIDRLWFSWPTPYGWGCYTQHGPVQHQNQPVTFKFKLLAGGSIGQKDIVNNPKQTIIVSKPASNLDTFLDKQPTDFWMSKPNPSAFGVETLYFDISQENQPVVVDNIYLDPLTPGIYVNVYYSNDARPGTDLITWDALKWKHVPTTFRLQQAKNYVLPAPITAKYIALEFSHLKAETYDPGQFPRPIKYRKHPKWVLDYFLLRLATDNRFAEDNFIADRVQVNYDALDFAYNYYLDDLQQLPESFAALSPGANNNVLSQFLADRTGTSDQVDATTLRSINLALASFQLPPGLQGPLDHILTLYSGANYGNYPVEVPSDPTAIPTDVSSLQRESIIYEKSFPVMFFYVESRHLYREVSAPLSYNRAYFAGLKSVAFTRNKYTTVADDPLYIEGVGDNVNVFINDFATSDDFAWVVHP